MPGKFFFPFVLTAALLMIPLLSIPDEPSPSSVSPPSSSPSSLPASTMSPIAIQVSVPSSSQTRSDTMIRLLDDAAQEWITLPLEEYLVHVVAAEMPASYAPEALRAQAVAARSYTLYKLQSGHLCTSSQHCQAYANEETLRQRWGEDYDVYLSKVRDAVYSTQGEIMTYDGTPIQALFHAASYGATEDVEHVYQQPLPYLRSVSTLESEEDSKRVLTWTLDDFLAAIQKQYPALDIDASQLEKELKILEHYPSGRVASIQVGNLLLTGVDMRRALGLPSSQFTVSIQEDLVTVTCLGYGHGIGMSQQGANLMANQGAGYQTILAHYYSGVTIETMPESFTP